MEHFIVNVKTSQVNKLCVRFEWKVLQWNWGNIAVGTGEWKMYWEESNQRKEEASI